MVSAPRSHRPTDFRRRRPRSGDSERDAMARSAAKKHRGVYEYPPDSDVWWVQYFVDGRRRRERVGGKQAAIDRYQQRKTEAREGRLPTRERLVRLDDFIRDYLAGETHTRSYVTMARHGRRGRNYFKGRS